MLSFHFPFADINEQKVDKLQDGSETLARADTDKHEVNVIGDASEAQMDLDKMLSSEVQDTRRETSGLGDKPAQEGTVGALY
jgi:antiviral helicase SKI2